MLFIHLHLHKQLGLVCLLISPDPPAAYHTVQFPLGNLLTLPLVTSPSTLWRLTHKTCQLFDRFNLAQNSHQMFVFNAYLFIYLYSYLF